MPIRGFGSVIAARDTLHRFSRTVHWTEASVTTAPYYRLVTGSSYHVIIAYCQDYRIARTQRAIAKAHALELALTVAAQLAGTHRVPREGGSRGQTPRIEVGDIAR